MGGKGGKKWQGEIAVLAEDVAAAIAGGREWGRCGQGMALVGRGCGGRGKEGIAHRRYHDDHHRFPSPPHSPWSLAHALWNIISIYASGGCSDGGRLKPRLKAAPRRRPTSAGFVMDEMG